MTTTVSNTVGAVTINSTTPYFLTASGVVIASSAINFTAGSEPGELIIAGNVSANSRGVVTNGNDHIDVTQTGVVLATDASDPVAIFLSGTGNTVRIAGTVTSDGIGIYTSSATQEIVITETGVVRGGASSHENGGGNSYSGAIMPNSDLVTIVNNGDIIGEVDPDSGFRIAVGNSSAGSADNGLNPLSNFDLTFFNTGFVHGDVYFSAGEDIYDARGGGIVNGLIDMGRDADIFRGGEGDEMALGGLGADTMNGGSGMDTLNGQGGTDSITGGDGSDNLSGGAHSDTIRGQDGSDELFGGEGGDFMTGGFGDDEIRGQGGNDDLRGGTGDDLIYGGSGQDTIIGGTGNDTMRGDSQFDTYVFNDGFGQDLILFFSGNDAEKIDLSSVSRIRSFNDLVNNHLSQEGSDALIDAGDGNVITLAGFNSNNLDPGDFIF